MTLSKLHPGVTLEEARSEVGWPLRALDPLEETTQPDPEILRLLREELDPKGGEAYGAFTVRSSSGTKRRSVSPT